MRRLSRRAVLVAILAALALWIAFDEPDRGQEVIVKAAAPPRNSQAASSVARSTELPARSALAEMRGDLFSARSWQPPPSKSAAPSVPPAPPLPYRFAGRLHEAAGLSVFLARGDNVFPVKQGDTLDLQYRVEALSVSEVTLVHLPSGTHQTIGILTLFVAPAAKTLFELLSVVFQELLLAIASTKF